MILRFLLKWAVIAVVVLFAWGTVTGAIRQAYWWMYP